MRQVGGAGKRWKNAPRRQSGSSNSSSSSSSSSSSTAVAASAGRRGIPGRAPGGRRWSRRCRRVPARTWRAGRGGCRPRLSCTPTADTRGIGADGRGGGGEGMRGVGGRLDGTGQGPRTRSYLVRAQDVGLQASTEVHQRVRDGPFVVLRRWKHHDRGLDRVAAAEVDLHVVPLARPERVRCPTQFQRPVHQRTQRRRCRAGRDSLLDVHRGKLVRVGLHVRPVLGDQRVAELRHGAAARAGGCAVVVVVALVEGRRCTACLLVGGRLSAFPRLLLPVLFGCR